MQLLLFSLSGLCTSELDNYYFRRHKNQQGLNVMADNIKIEKINTDYKSLKNKNLNNMTTEVMQNTDPGFSKKKQKKT